MGRVASCKMSSLAFDANGSRPRMSARGKHYGYKRKGGIYMKSTKRGIVLGALAVAICSAFNSPAVMANPQRTFPVVFGQPIVLNAGDSAVISMALTSYDPNEDGEGEGVVMTGSGGGAGCTTSILSFNTPVVLDCGPVPAGQQWTLISGPLGGLDGDEVLVGTAQINTPNAVRKTQSEIDALENAAHRDDALAQMYDMLNAICQSSGAAEALCLITGKDYPNLAGLLRANAYMIAAIAADPPDSNFTQIVQPVLQYYPPMVFPSEIPLNVANDINALHLNYQQQTGLAFSVYTSLNRASGALQAGMTDWQKAQVAAAAKYSYQLGAVLKLEPSLSATLQKDLVAAGITVPTGTPSQAYDVDLQILSSGLPSAEQAVATTVGLNANDIQQITNVSFVQNAMEVAALLSTSDGSAAWANSSRNSDILAAASALQQFAIDNGYSPIDCSKATPSVSVIWPPNHKMTPVGVNGIVDADGSAFTVAITAIQQDEPLGPQEIGGSGIDTPTAEVRAERDGNGDGRIYQIGFSATDTSGGTCTGSVLVSVPHDQHHPAVDNGQRYNSTGQ